MLTICGVSRGRYAKPRPTSEVKFDWVDEEGNPSRVPLKHSCEHDKHWQWGPGTRNGQKLYFPTNETFYQKWHLTEEEIKEALEQYDVFSLEMSGRIICKKCAEREMAIVVR